MKPESKYGKHLAKQRKTIKKELLNLQRIIYKNYKDEIPKKTRKLTRQMERYTASLNKIITKSETQEFQNQMKVQVNNIFQNVYILRESSHRKRLTPRHQPQQQDPQALDVLERQNRPASTDARDVQVHHDLPELRDRADPGVHLPAAVPDQHPGRPPR